MRRLILLSLVLLCGSGLALGNGPHGGVGVSFGIFYSSLGPYGDWVYAGNGVYGWHPRNVATAWRPYYHGHWVWSVDGWFWVSNEPWAWAVYHYGRWYYDDYYGWIWIPGYDWAPAWVEWRYEGSCVGWAPLGPYAVFGIDFGIHYYHSWSTPYTYWTFLNVRYLDGYAVNHYAYPPSRSRYYLGRTRSAGTVFYERGRIVTRGPGREELERRTGRRIPVVDLERVSERGRAGIRRDGDRRILEVYRPRFDGRASQSIATGERPERVRRDGRGVELNMEASDAVRGMRDRTRNGQGGESGRFGQSRTDVRLPGAGETGRVEAGGSRPTRTPDRSHKVAPSNGVPFTTGSSTRPERSHVSVPAQRPSPRDGVSNRDRSGSRGQATPPQVERRVAGPERSGRQVERNQQEDRHREADRSRGRGSQK